MKKVIMYLFIILITLTTMGCEYKEVKEQSKTQSISTSTDNTENQVIDENNEYLQNLQLLKDEMKKMNSSLSPKDTYYVCSLVNKYILEVLNEKDSLDMQPEDILGTNSNYYIKISETVTIDKLSYRLIEFGLKEIKMGGIVKIYLQCWDDGKKLNVQEIHELNITESVNSILYSNILYLEENYYVLIAEKLYDTENTYINFLTFKHQGNKWTVYNGISNIDKDNWLLERHEGGFSITNEIVTDVEQYDYSLSLIDNKLIINVVDEKDNVLGTLELRFVNDNWINEL